MYNAITFNKNVLKCVGAKAFTHINYVGSDKISDERVTNFLLVDDLCSGELSGNLYISSLMLDDKKIDKVIEHRFRTHCSLMVQACSTLYEVGTCHKKYGLSPIEYAHKLGLLEESFIVGAVHIERDDIDLINQSNAKIILTPSDSMWKGEGIPPLRMMLNLGADVYLGTGEGLKNPECDLEFEKRLIALSVSGLLNEAHAISDEVLDEMTRFR